MEKTTVKTTTLCKNLLNNAQYTDKTHFIGKSIGENIYKNWLDCLKEIKHNSFLYYEALATERENIEEFEKSVYNSIKKLLVLIGDIPSFEDENTTSKVNSKILFLDAIRYSVKDDCKIEVEKLKNAREKLRQAKKNYKDNCLTSDGIVKNGLNQSYIDSFVTEINKAQQEIDKLLKVKNNSVYGCEEMKISTFAKKFEIQLRKQMLKQYHFTVKQVNEEKAKLKKARKENRKKDK